MSPFCHARRASTGSSTSLFGLSFVASLGNDLEPTCGLDISSAHLPFRCQRRFAHRAAAQLTLPTDGPLGRGRALTPHRMLARRRRCPADNYLTCMTPSHVPRCVTELLGKHLSLPAVPVYDAEPFEIASKELVETLRTSTPLSSLFRRASQRPSSLDALLSVEKERRKRRGPLTRRFIVTEGIFEKDGAMVDFPKLATQIDMLVGSVSNGLNSSAGFCTGSHIVVDHQCINGTSFVIFATVPAHHAVSASEGIIILRNTPSIFSTQQETVRTIRAVVAQGVWITHACRLQTVTTMW
ncbi:hypothetical protein V8E53_002925 [Lactarius tabidus]